MKHIPFFTKIVIICFSITFIFITNFCSASSAAPAQGEVKYIFYFIGDGMGSVQIHAAEAYLASLAEGYSDSKVGTKLTENLNFDNFPAFGMATTYAANRFITDSGAAGTALACGKKTLCDTISVGTDRQTPYVTIAEQAKAKGMKVGIVSSVGMDHATPAVFYAHEANRNNYYNIGVQLANSNFDYFAGGSLHQPVQRAARGRRSGAADANAPAAKNAYDIAMEKGFKIVTSRQDLNTCKPGERIIAYNKSEESKNQFYPAIDKPDDCVSLAEFTSKGIELLNNDKGFFMMVEGGQVDEACHDNDAVTAIYETIAFSKAIDEALTFYKQHQDETLIVIAADHETGGMTLGSTVSQYNTDFELFKNQKMSQGRFTDTVLSKYTSGQWNGIKDNIPDNLKTDITEAFGIVYDKLNAYEKSLLENAYDKYMSTAKRIRISADELPNQDKILSFGMTLTTIYNNRAGIGWTTTAHTGAPIEVHAIGVKCERLNGFYDNTDIPKRMAKLIGVELNN